jgi:hypothetical protein
VVRAGNGDDGNNVKASSSAKATDVATSSTWNKKIIYIFSYNKDKKKIYTSYKNKTPLYVICLTQHANYS